MKAILEWLAQVFLFVMLMVWCALSATGAIWAAGLLPLEDAAQRAALVLAGIGGVVGALWVVAKVTGSRL